MKGDTKDLGKKKSTRLLKVYHGLTRKESKSSSLLYWGRERTHKLNWDQSALLYWRPRVKVTAGDKKCWNQRTRSGSRGWAGVKTQLAVKYCLRSNCDKIEKCYRFCVPDPWSFSTTYLYLPPSPNSNPFQILQLLLRFFNSKELLSYQSRLYT